MQMRIAFRGFDCIRDEGWKSYGKCGIVGVRQALDCLIEATLRIKDGETLIKVECPVDINVVNNAESSNWSMDHDMSASLTTEPRNSTPRGT